jgi:integrase
MDKLTEITIRQAKPKLKQYKLFDGGGMFLLVHPNGSKYWRMKFNFEDKSKLASFGIWPDISLKDARGKRYEAKKKIKDGINPIEEKRKERQNNLDRANKDKLEAQKESITFGKVAEEWHKRQTLHWTEKHANDVLNSLKHHVYPDLGEKPISTITKQDVIANLRKIEAEGMHETCYRVRQRLEAIFDYAGIEDHCIGNPSKGLQRIFTKPKSKSHNSLPISELPKFISKVDASEGVYPSTVLAMKFMILTFVRTGELRLADWKEFDINCAEPLWVIPGERMKMGKTHHVPLSRQSVSILEDMQQYSGPKGYVFPQVRNPKKPMSNNTLLYFSNRLGYAGRNTIHGFRSTVSTVLNESRKWHTDVIELQQAHQEQNKVRKAYNRAEHLDERRKMMQWWSDYVESLSVSTDAIGTDEKQLEK